MKPKFALAAFILLMAAFALISPAQADGIIVPDPPICDPAPCPPVPISMSQLEIRFHHVDVRIEDQIATTRVDQVFYNPNDWTVEGTYIFPLPAEAAVTDFTLWIDGEPVKGEVLSAEEARRIYETIVRELQDPALLEYAGRGAVQARIFPLAPGSERRIQLEYTQALIAEEGLVRYVYPLNTEKFSTRPLEEVRVSVDIRARQPIQAVYSPSHSVAVSRIDEFNISAGYEALNVRPDTDFILYYSIGESEALHLLSYRDPADAADPDGFFLALLAPRPDAAAQPVRKDVILVLDRSGSMEGEKFVQAQAALQYILQQLNTEDRFNVISFSTGLETYAQELRGTADIPEAVAWVDRQSAAGSTDINRALLEAAAMADAERPTYLIFLTDGLPTEGVTESDQILNNFAASAPDNSRLFVFGVGYDVDTYLLDSLAQEHHGTSTYVRPGYALDEAISAFYEKISTPVLTDLQLDFGELSIYDLYPDPLPDLFAGSQIVVLGRYREGGQTNITLTGKINSQTDQTFIFLDQVFEEETAISTPQPAIPRLWATRKIGNLLNQIRLQGPVQELVDQIVYLSIRYGIVTPYTAYLVTDAQPLGAVEQARIANEAFAAMKAAPAAPSYGRDAVEQAAGEGAMREAEAVSAPSVEMASRVRIVGSRAFVFSNGVWLDTAFDPGRMETVKVAFLSDDYFALAASDPQLGAAFALASSVIAISDGIAYEVLPADTVLPAVEIPEAAHLPVPAEIDSSLTPAPTAEQPGTLPNTAAESPAASKPLPCLGGILPLMLLPLAGLAISRRYVGEKIDINLSSARYTSSRRFLKTKRK